ncbi:hypothetical protein D3C87_1582540 [compost metagenome]
MIFVAALGAEDVGDTSSPFFLSEFGIVFVEIVHEHLIGDPVCNGFHSLIVLTEMFLWTINGNSIRGLRFSETLYKFRKRMDLVAEFCF